MSALVLLLAACQLRAQADSTWRDHNRAAEAAIARRDWPEARTQLLTVERLLGNHPGAVMALARLGARAGDTTEVLTHLRRIAAMGVVSRGIGDTLFDWMRQSPSLRSVAATLAANAATIGSAQVVATLPDSGSIAEDLSFEPSLSRFIVTDLRRRRLLSVGLDGRVSAIGAPLPSGWGMLGVAVDAARGAAWVTAVTLPQAEGYTRADSGRAAILRYDLATGTVLRRFEMPSPSAAAPGDIAIAENHDVFIGDGQTGAVYVIRASKETLDTLVPEGGVRGSQQPAIAPDRRSLFIASYGRGIARVDRATGAVTWLAIPPDVTLTGIDGLVMHGRDLIAVQNGVVPSRIVRLVLDGAQTRVVRADILLRDTTLADEPTHAVIAQGALYAIGNAGWAKYDDNGAPRPALAQAAPRIVRIPLPAR